MMKRIVLVLAVVCLVLAGCGRGEAVPSSGGGPVASGAFSEPEKEDSSESSSAASGPEAGDTGTSEEVSGPSQPPSPDLAEGAEEELLKLGQRALDKWAGIGHCLAEPLYNTDLSQLGQEEFRQIYSVYLYYTGQYDTLVSEEFVTGKSASHWTGEEGLAQFVQSYFGLSYRELESKLPEDKRNGEDIAFYFNARFSVLADGQVQYTLLDCARQEDGSFKVRFHLQFQDAALDDHFGEPDVTFFFILREDEINFLGAVFEKKTE